MENQAAQSFTKALAKVFVTNVVAVAGMFTGVCLVGLALEKYGKADHNQDKTEEQN